MVVLYSGSGAGDFSLQGKAVSQIEKDRLFSLVNQLLVSRGQRDDARWLTLIPFEIHNAHNHFNDDFEVLHAEVDLQHYEALRQKSLSGGRSSFHTIASAFNEVGRYVRFIAVSLKGTTVDTETEPSGLTGLEVDRLINTYIGVNGGYLGDFSYPSHHDFYVNLNLPINPNQYEGTTRHRFRHILLTSRSAWQATILEGILAKYPPGSSDLRTAEKSTEIQSWILRLRGLAVTTPDPLSTSDTVRRALDDAELLIKNHKPISAVDRIHTALHGHVKTILRGSNIPFDDRSSLSAVFSILKNQHPKFQGSKANAAPLLKILRSLSSIVEVMNQLRNEGSIAHPNDDLLDDQEAMLIVNISRSMLAYIESTLSN